MDPPEVIQSTADRASQVTSQMPGEITVTQFMGRFIVSAIAIAAGYYIYMKFLTRRQDEPDALTKLVLDDPIGKLFLDAKERMDKTTSEWWQAAKHTLLTEELRNALDTIGNVLVQLDKFDSELELGKTRTPVFVLLGIIRRAQEEEAAAGKVLLPPLIEEEEDEEEDTSTGIFLNFPISLKFFVEAKIFYQSFVKYFEYSFTLIFFDSLTFNYVLGGLPSKEFSDAKWVAKYAINIYAASIFGWTDKSVAEKLGLVNTTDIVIRDFDSTNHPRFVVLTDHSASMVVLAIRGTYSIGDAIIDIVCDEMPFLDGFAHHGMVDAADRILKKVLPVLRSLLVDKYPGYKLRVTGHSLGAGTAELITMILLSNTKDGNGWLSNIDIKCIALAPPPVYRPANILKPLEEYVQKKIIIFVNGNDCVPRLSLANCAWLLSALRAIDNLNLSVYEQLSIIVQKGTAKELPIIQPSNIVNNNLQKVTTAIRGIDGQYQERFKYLNHPSAYVYYLESSGKGSPRTNSPVLLVRRKAKYFSHLLLVFSKMIADHLQWNYDAALDKVTYEYEDGDDQDGSIKTSKVITSNSGSSLVLI